MWLQDRLDDLRENSLAAALEAEHFRSEHGFTAARGELMSDQQLADLNSQLILAQADAASATSRYQQLRRSSKAVRRTRSTTPRSRRRRAAVR